MTALSQYERLESLGLWRAARGEQRREVIVSFGNATLVVSDAAGRPLSHWSLPAIIQLNQGVVPAIFAPDADVAESLEIDDPIMIDAINTVRGQIVKAKPRRGRLRHGLTAAVLLALTVAAASWGPGLLRDQAAGSLSDLRRAQVGAAVLGHLQASTGPACRGAQGRAALQTLQTRLFGLNRTGQVIILPGVLPGPASLPGNLTVIDRATLVRYDDPFVTAGDIVASRTRADDPVQDILRHAGLRATVHLLTSGTLPDTALSSYAAYLLDQGQPPVSEAQLIPAFAAAKIPTAPYAELRTARGQNGARLMTAKPLNGAEPEPVLTDAAWLQLQSICDN